MLTTHKNPSPRDLLVFAGALPFFFALVGAQRWHAGYTSVAMGLWLGGAVVSIVAWSVPRGRYWIYVGWMTITYPIAWAVSHWILAVIYFVVVTPLAVALRALGRDAMHRTFDKRAGSYWVMRDRNRDPADYFRQF